MRTACMSAISRDTRTCAQQDGHNSKKRKAAKSYRNNHFCNVVCCNDKCLPSGSH